MPNWTTFDRRSRPVSDEAYVTIQRRGTFSFNQAAKAAIGDSEAVELLYDAGACLIGFRPVDPSNPRAYRLRKQGRANNWIIGGQAFTKAFHVNTDTAMRYRATVDDGVLVVDLNQPGTDATGPRLANQDG